MRVAFYLGHYPSPGGTTTSVRGLTQALAKAGWQVDILSQGPNSGTWSDGPVTVRRFLRTRARARVPFLTSRQLLADLRANRAGYDLIVMNGIFHPDLPPLARAASVGKIPYVVAPHDPYHPSIFRNRRVWKETYWGLVERRLLRGAAAIQLLAATHQEHLLARGVSRPTLVAPNGVDPSLVLPALSKPRSGNSVTIGALGRMDLWQKGLDLLLGSVAKVRARGHEVRLVIQGRDQRDRARLTKLADTLGMQGAVSFPPPSADAVETIGRWDILVVASRFEGFGLTAVEAMVAGTPVLCSEEAGVAEHVRQAGCGVIALPSVEGLTAGLLQLLERREKWPRMASAGQAYVSTELRWDRIASSVATQYQQLVEPRRR